MKYLVQTLLILMLSQSAYSFGAGPVGQQVDPMGDTVRTLNQVSEPQEAVNDNEKVETEEEQAYSPQDVQEKQYQEDMAREEEEWEETKSLDQYRFDVPE